MTRPSYRLSLDPERILIVTGKSFIFEEHVRKM